MSILRRSYNSCSSIIHDFKIIPNFLTLSEQRILLRAALQKLDSHDSTHVRRRRKAWISQRNQSLSTNVQDLFCPEEYYEFQEGHFDGVINDFRETHVASWPQEIDGLSPILDRLKSIYPSQDTQTHLLHLASRGAIQPHVDNLSASGSWILGVSLGADRIMRLERRDRGETCELHDVLLPSGSVYIQKDDVRYRWVHSILRDGEYNGRYIAPGQRISVMVRDRTNEAPLA